MEEGWDREEFMQGIVKIKNISYIHKKYIGFRTKNHYKIACCIFGFTQSSLREQKQLLRKDNSIHFPTQYDKYMYSTSLIALILAFIAFIIRMAYDI